MSRRTDIFAWLKTVGLWLAVVALLLFTAAVVMSVRLPGRLDANADRASGGGFGDFGPGPPPP
jgi:hypothetical protein